MAVVVAFLTVASGIVKWHNAGPAKTRAQPARQELPMQKLLTPSLLGIVLTVGRLLGSSPADAAAPAVTDPPPRNVVLIISDDQHWRDYAFLGHPHLRTPALDRLAR